ncbi:hypothetical protein QE381_003148 [Microbacterium sp. SORGH_AS 888]|nr:hypothetical protein [Microbacterium sp. SORGH_AS_0888]MDQ1131020.1 hypothetical protein [Microbacterium sp. SORGH_AS_0888]
MRDQKRCHARLAKQRQHAVADTGAKSRIQCVERLVEQHHRRLRGERTRYRHALTLTTRQFVRHPVGKVVEVHQGEQAPDIRVLRRPAGAHAAQAIGDVGRDAQPGEQRALLGDETDAATVRGHVGEVATTRQDTTGGQRVQPRDHAQQRGLAAPRRPQHRDDLATIDS